jgi:hypothetical protein
MIGNDGSIGEELTDYEFNFLLGTFCGRSQDFESGK